MTIDFGGRRTPSIPFLPFDPTGPVGFPDPRGEPGTIENVRDWLVSIGGRICPPGTRCVGAGVEAFGISACIGSCVEMTGDRGNGGVTIPLPGIPTDVPTCQPNEHLELRAGELVCVQTVGPEGERFPPGVMPTAANGCACPGGVGAPKPCRCCLPGGGSGTTNKSGYYTYGRCGDPSRPTYHAPGTKCVKGRRSINPTNIRAGRRAVTRVNAVHRELLKVENAMAKFAKTPTRRKK